MAEIFIHKSGMATDVETAVKGIFNVLYDQLSDVDGKIWIVPSVDSHTGTGLHDIDILMFGYLDDYLMDEIAGYQNIKVRSFCTTIEAKSHDADGVYSDGTHLWVKYPDHKKNVTSQSDEQKNTLSRFLNEHLNMRDIRLPRISNLILLTGVSHDEFVSTIKLTNSNILTCDFKVDDLFDAIGRQYYLKHNGYVDAFRNFSRADIQNMADVLCARHDGVDTMTLKKMYFINKECELLKDIEKRTEPVIVLSGHAGTGKTIMLLQAANKLMKLGRKCLFLTLNVALINDLRHTLSYMPKDMSNIKMQSMHSFMINILRKNGLWNDKSDIENDFSPAINSLYRIKNRIKTGLDYDYVFIDEAQDWEKPVPDLMKYLFKNSHIVIADGVDQFMRSSEHSDWGSPNIPTLKKCLRQRRNLTVFAKMFASKLGVYWNVEPNSELPGGKVLIYNQYEEKTHRDLLKNTIAHGCAAYDLMLLASNSLVTSGKFDSKTAYEGLGIHLFDGVDDDNRNRIYDQANANRQESRVYTYESCRGLEAWTTVCLRFDELFTKQHHHDYREIEYSAARTHMLTLWALMPLTRAVDTLVLVVNEGSEISQVLKELAVELPDFVTYNK